MKKGKYGNRDQDITVNNCELKVEDNSSSQNINTDPVSNFSFLSLYNFIK